MKTEWERVIVYYFFVSQKGKDEVESRGLMAAVLNRISLFQSDMATFSSPYCWIRYPCRFRCREHCLLSLFRGCNRLDFQSMNFAVRDVSDRGLARHSDELITANWITVFGLNVFRLIISFSYHGSTVSISSSVPQTVPHLHTKFSQWSIHTSCPRRKR